mgnify:CR=1 FL=1
MKNYFAYGSNLCLKRFTDPSRVPSAALEGIGTIDGFRIVFHKPSKDGSGKATLIADSESKVIGALFTYDEKEHKQLRRAEGGYREELIKVSTSGGDVEALTFVCEIAKLDSALLPYNWYVDLIRCGGSSLGFPKEYLLQFDLVKTKTDPCSARVEREREFLK